jgi:hypothetical protein
MFTQCARNRQLALFKGPGERAAYLCARQANAPADTRQRDTLFSDPGFDLFGVQVVQDYFSLTMKAD